MERAALGERSKIERIYSKQAQNLERGCIQGGGIHLKEKTRLL